MTPSFDGRTKLSRPEFEHVECKQPVGVVLLFAFVFLDQHFDRRDVEVGARERIARQERIVKRGAEDVKLSPKEYDILEQLVIHAGKVLTHKHLLREVWRDESVDPQYLRVYVRQLRQKVEDDPSTPRHVLTEPGVGYRLV